MPPIELSNAWKSGARIINTSIALLPNFVLAIIIFVLFLILASSSKSLTRRFTMRRRTHRGVALLISRLVQTSIVILGFLIALSVVAPSFQAADLIKMLGIGSVAIGFAFQNILQNFLAGILLLVSEPFQLGDLISVTGIEGNVEDIQARATVVTTKEGRHVVIPNAVLFTNPVAVAAASQSGREPVARA
jgi:small conductance mechanosensitive channel